MEELVTRMISRVIVFDAETRKVLLVRNKGSDFWYAPGGGWEANQEDIRACAERELLEETGVAGKIDRLIYAQQFHESDTVTFLEWFWLAHPVSCTVISSKHRDDHGIVCETRWFSREELQDKTIFPKRLKGSFWDHVDSWPSEEDPFLGVS